ncbi:hypothetical protein C8J57DRAFT_102538 [Mycena rebaudengoi]|nr:hypothetical protein C8J57DRAFT_102538 [Mycena rebaudengoi]
MCDISGWPISARYRCCGGIRGDVGYDVVRSVRAGHSIHLCWHVARPHGVLMILTSSPGSEEIAPEHQVFRLRHIFLVFVSTPTLYLWRRDVFATLEMRICLLFASDSPSSNMKLRTGPVCSILHPRANGIQYHPRAPCFQSAYSRFGERRRCTARTLSEVPLTTRSSSFSHL